MLEVDGKAPVAACEHAPREPLEKLGQALAHRVCRAVRARDDGLAAASLQASDVEAGESQVRALRGVQPDRACAVVHLSRELFHDLGEALLEALLRNEPQMLGHIHVGRVAQEVRHVDDLAEGPGPRHGAHEVDAAHALRELDVAEEDVRRGVGASEQALGVRVGAELQGNAVQGGVVTQDTLAPGEPRGVVIAQDRSHLAHANTSRPFP